MNNVRRVAEIMRRGAAMGHRRWRMKQLVRRTGMGYTTVYDALKLLEAQGVVENKSPEWVWKRPSK